MNMRWNTSSLWVCLLGWVLVPGFADAAPAPSARSAAKTAAPAQVRPQPAAKAAPTAPTSRPAAKAARPQPPRDSMLHNVVLSGMARVCVRSDIPPLGYFKGETLSGFDIALAKEIVTGLSIKYNRDIRPQWVMIRAAERIPHLKNGSCDFVVAAFSKTPARARQVAFSQVYYQTSKVVLRRKEDLSGSPVIARVSKTTPGTFHIPNAVHSSFLSYSDILYTMRQKLVDYVITDYPIGLYLVRHSNAAYQIYRPLPNQESYSIGVNKGHTYLLREINQILTQLKQSGRMSYLRRQWLR